MGNLTLASVLIRTRNNVSYVMMCAVVLILVHLKVLSIACNMTPSPEVGQRLKVFWKESVS